MANVFHTVGARVVPTASPGPVLGTCRRALPGHEGAGRAVTIEGG